MIEKVREKTESTGGSQQKGTGCGCLNLVGPRNWTNTIKWPRPEQFNNEEKVATIELMVKETADNIDWDTMAIILSRLVGVRKFKIQPLKRMIALRFNQGHINVAKIHYILTNHGYNIKLPSLPEETEQKVMSSSIFHLIDYEADVPTPADRPSD